MSVGRSSALPGGGTRRTVDGATSGGSSSALYQSSSTETEDTGAASYVSGLSDWALRCPGAGLRPGSCSACLSRSSASAWWRGSCGGCSAARSGCPRWLQARARLRRRTGGCKVRLGVGSAVAARSPLGARSPPGRRVGQARRWSHDSMPSRRTSPPSSGRRRAGSSSTKGGRTGCSRGSATRRLSWSCRFPSQRSRVRGPSSALLSSLPDGRRGAGLRLAESSGWSCRRAPS
jgi:hypothetical protein